MKRNNQLVKTLAIMNLVKEKRYSTYQRSLAAGLLRADVQLRLTAVTSVVYNVVEDYVDWQTINNAINRKKV
ncbi:hypothetical protein BLOT_007319 [Blomia tropicalis]|nr:hypothetical protein BLOT_007319 [Blomia tropicalis]